MADTNSTQMTWQDRLIRELGRDKKKTVILTVLIFVGLFVVGRTLTKKSSAKTTDASDSLVVSETGDPSGMGISGVTMTTPQEHRTAWVRNDITSNESRDLFEFQGDYYELIEPAVDEQPEIDIEEETSGSADVVAETEPDKETLIRQQASQLELQSIMQGGSPVAIIDGNVVGVGERIAGFEVISIEANRCTLRQDGVEVRLVMPD
jgi:hypothetical protein